MKQSRRILLAGAGEELRLLLDRALGVLPDVQLDLAPSAEPQALNGRAVAADVLLVEVDLQSAASTDAFVRLAGATAQRKVIAAARNAEPEDVRRLFRAGAADVLTAPFTPIALEAALGEVLGRPTRERSNGRVITVLRCSGGAGATTVALNLAALTAKPERKAGRVAKRVAFLDFDLQFGDADLALNLEPKSTIVDVLRAEKRFDGQLLQGAMVDHASGLRILASPPKLIPLDALNASFAARIVRQSAQLHDYTFVDLPLVWTDWTLPILRESSLLLMVGAPTVQGAVGARRVLDALQESGVETPVLFVLNKLAGMVDAFEKPSRIGKSLSRNIDASLIFDAAAARAFERGVLLADAYPNARITRELRGLSAKLDPAIAQTERQRQTERAGAAA
jgi:pilus assembly protein CpaE